MGHRIFFLIIAVIWLGQLAFVIAFVSTSQDTQREDSVRAFPFSSSSSKGRANDASSAGLRYQHHLDHVDLLPHLRRLPSLWIAFDLCRTKDH